MASRGRILIVDDEANARAALSEILHEDGYVTETAADGFKALGKLGEFEPDVVLTDLKMPGLDGIGLMEKGREVVPVKRTMLMDLSSLKNDDGSVLALDNIEGITFGPLHEGKRTLILVSDNNFNPAQFTQFIAFTLDGNLN